MARHYWHARVFWVPRETWVLRRRGSLVVGQSRLLRRQGRNTHRLISLHRPWLHSNRRRLASLSLFRSSPTTRRVFLPSLRHCGKYCQTDPLPVVWVPREAGVLLVA